MAPYSPRTWSTSIQCLSAGLQRSLLVWCVPLVVIGDAYALNIAHGQFFVQPHSPLIGGSARHLGANWREQWKIRAFVSIHILVKFLKLFLIILNPTFIFCTGCQFKAKRPPVHDENAAKWATPSSVKIRWKLFSLANSSLGATLCYIIAMKNQWWLENDCRGRRQITEKCWMLPQLYVYKWLVVNWGGFGVVALYESWVRAIIQFDNDYI